MNFDQPNWDWQNHWPKFMRLLNVYKGNTFASEIGVSSTQMGCDGIFCP